MNTFSDEALMTKVAEGQTTHLGILFERYQKKIYNYFLRQVGDPGRAEDLTQDVFFRILRYRSGYKGGASFKSWLYRIAHNVAMDAFGKNKGDQPLPEEIEQEQEGHGLGGMIHSENLNTMRAAFQGLSQEKQEVLILSRFEDMKYGEIAEVTGASVSAVKVRVHRALKDLRQRFFHEEKQRAS